jgi:hypothetical protein
LRASCSFEVGELPISSSSQWSKQAADSSLDERGTTWLRMGEASARTGAGVCGMSRSLTRGANSVRKSKRDEVIQTEGPWGSAVKHNLFGESSIRLLFVPVFTTCVRVTYS